MAAQSSQWTEVNQRYLVAALAEVKACVERHAGSPDLASKPESSTALETETNGAPPALEMLTRVFGLSRFERAILVLCAGMELDSGFAALCARAQGETARAYPTFSLALAALPEPHWTALAPAGPLRRWRLIEVGGAPGASLTSSPLRIDERILHHLAGIQYLDRKSVV